MKRLYYILLIMCLGLASCTDNILNYFSDSQVEFEKDEAVRFTTNVPSLQNTTRAYKLDANVINSYKTIEDAYEISVKMFEEGNTNAIGTGMYKPQTIEKDNDTQYDEDGALTPIDNSNHLLWETNVKKYAFEASAGTETLEADQSTYENWIAQDKLHGYAYVPLLNDDDSQVDKIDAPNYHTNKEWGDMNKTWHDLDKPGTMLSTEHYKYIPLFLQHQRSWITLILKAGKGIKREALKFTEAQKNAAVSFYSYDSDGTSFTIDKSWAQPATVDYAKDKNGEAETGAETTSFNVIVEPHNYNDGEHALDQKIASISLSGLKFSFCAGNDENYTNSILNLADDASDADKAKKNAAVEAMNAYKLEPGKHLTITAVLSTDRIVFITAWIEDWTEVATSTICDDYGQNGDPILINSRQDLIDFLEGENNKSGNVAIVVANSLNLDTKITTEYYTAEDDEVKAGTKKVGDVKNTSTSEDSWNNYSGNTLKATLNMAGSKFYTASQFLSKVESSGSIINGTFVMNNTSPVPSAVAGTNEGTLERVSVTKGASSAAKASRGGFVVTNKGTIYQCTSAIPVYNEGGSDVVYIGGIAAESVAPSTSTMAVIDGCTVTASVKGGNNVIGGGIVGQAEGRVTNNTFEYGITLLQPINRFKNIIGAKANGALRAQNNSWPTITLNKFDDSDAVNANSNTTAQYNNVLDCQQELAELLTSQYNIADKKYRISDSFTVLSQDWNYGTKHDDVTKTDVYCEGNLYCQLDGNNKTITLDGTATVKIPTKVENGKVTEYGTAQNTSHMLFSNITGSVSDLIINIKTPLIATPDVNKENNVLTATDAIAPLAYAVKGSSAVVKNVKVKMENRAYVQAALPAGIVCWAWDGATVDGCEVTGPIKSWLPPGSISTGDGDKSDARRYAGGIVALAVKATIKNCVYHTASNTLELAAASSAQVYYGGILGGTTIKTVNSASEEPAVSIIDCTSWFAPSTSDTYKGAVLGYGVYTKNNNPINGTVTTGANACQGNWWNTTYNGVASMKAGMKTEDVIGKCNSYTPINNVDY